MPRGRAGQRRVLAEHQPAQVGGVQAVGVLVGVDAFQRGVLVQVLGQRQLHDVAGAFRVGVELVDGRVQLGLADVGGQIAADRVDPDLRAVGMLTADIRLGPGVVADQDRAQTRGTPASLSFATRSMRSTNISSRVALPSRTVAPTPDSLT